MISWLFNRDVYISDVSLCIVMCAATSCPGKELAGMGLVGIG